MTTIPQQSPAAGRAKHGWLSQLHVPEMWASLAIIAMWIAVLFDAIFGPDFVTESAGGDSVTVPSAIFLGLFAFLGTWVVARYGFGGRHRVDA